MISIFNYFKKWIYLYFNKYKYKIQVTIRYSIQNKLFSMYYVGQMIFIEIDAFLQSKLEVYVTSYSILTDHELISSRIHCLRACIVLMWISLKYFWFKVLPSKKINRENGHGISPLREMTRLENKAFTVFIKIIAAWLVASSCWKIVLFSFTEKWASCGIRKLRIIAMYRTKFKIITFFSHSRKIKG